MKEHRVVVLRCIPVGCPPDAVVCVKHRSVARIWAEHILLQRCLDPLLTPAFFVGVLHLQSEIWLFGFKGGWVRGEMGHDGR